MTASIVHNIGNATFTSVDAPANVPAACDAVLRARLQGAIPSLGILREWHRLLPAWVGIMGGGERDAVGNWAFSKFCDAARHGRHSLTDHFIQDGLHEIALAPHCPFYGPDCLLRAVTVNGKGTYTLDALLGAGLDVDQTGYENETALHCAAARGDHDKVLILLGWGADVHARDISGWTPLHHAAASPDQNLNVIASLVEDGADLNALTPNKATPADLAVNCSYEIPDAVLRRLATYPRRSDRRSTHATAPDDGQSGTIRVAPGDCGKYENSRALV